MLRLVRLQSARVHALTTVVVAEIEGVDMTQIDLWKAVRAAKLSANTALDIMQEAGAVSDLCVTLSDVAPADCEAGIRAIQEHERTK